MSSGTSRMPAPSRRTQPVGWWGMVLFLCSELTIFGVMMSSYFYLDFNVRHWPPYGIAPPHVTGPAIATGVLVAAAVPTWIASLRVRSGDRWAAIRWIGVGLVLQAGYLAAQIVFFARDLRDFSPHDSAYGSIYFTLLAAHHAHVAIGLYLDLAVMIRLATRGLTSHWIVGTRGLALYWTVVGGLAVPVILTVLSPSL